MITGVIVVAIRQPTTEPPANDWRKIAALGALERPAQTPLVARGKGISRITRNPPLRGPSMRKRRWDICVALLGLAGAVLAVALILHDYVRAEVLGGPLPSPPLPPDTIQLTPVEKLGKLMLYDSTLSNGYNPLGTKYIDYGLGANPDPAPDGTRF
jgi:hypothetical protein